MNVVTCDCGEVVTGATVEELIANAQAHAREGHAWCDEPSLVR